MIGPADLLLEADELIRSETGREVRWRTAMSRAYYAAFHSVAGVADARGYTFDRRSGKGMHAHLLAWLDRSGDQTLRKSGIILRTLKDRRTDADYRLRADLSLVGARETVDMARKLIAMIGAAC